MEEQVLKVRFDLSFAGHIVLYQFLPETESLGLHLTNAGGKYSIVAYMTDRSRQLETIANLSLSSEEEIHKQSALMCKGLTIEIQDASPEPSLMKSLESKEWNEETRRHVAKLVELAYDVINGIVEYFRNLGQQSWLVPSSPDGFNAQKTLEFALQELRARWLDSKNCWQPLTVGQRSWKVTHRSYFMDGVDVAEWKDVETFVEAFINTGKRAPVIDALIANSLEHLERRNTRLAIIEAVIALEGALVKGSLSTVIAGLNNPSELNEELIDQLIEKIGLRLCVKVVLKANAERFQIDSKDIDTILEAIAVRNEVIHHRRREIEFEKAEEYVFAIRKVIARLRGRNVFRRSQFGKIKINWGS